MTIPEIENLQWGENKMVETRNGPCIVRSAPPSAQFWNLWNEHKDALQAAGLSISKYGGEWTVNHWQRGEEFLYPALPEISSDVEEPLELLPLVNESNLKPWQPFAVQVCCAAMKRYQVCLNADGTGVGKTFETLGVARERNRRLLVICPKGITVDWVRAAHLMGVEIFTFGWEWMKTGKTPFGYWEMKGKKKVKFKWTVPDDMDIVFDEAQRSASISTQNAELVISAKNQEYPMILLSATIANDPTKMRATGYALGLHRDGREFYDWMIKHGVKQQEFMAGGRTIKVYKFMGSARHLQAIHKSIFPAKGCRRTAESLGAQFPATQVFAKAYDMEEEIAIREEYELMHERVNMLMMDKTKDDKQACILVEILRARQRVELLKVPLFVSLTKDYIEEGNSVFIAVNFVETLSELASQLKITSIISGLSSGKKIIPNYNEFARRNAMDDFQSNKVNIIAGIIAACREGISLHDLHGGHPRVGLFMPTPSAFHLKQLVGRLHRAGGMSPSFQNIVFAANTVEEDVARNLATKLDSMSLIIDGDLQKGIFPAGYSDMRPMEDYEK